MDQNEVFFNEPCARTLRAVPKSGGTARTDASSAKEPFELAVDGRHATTWAAAVRAHVGVASHQQPDDAVPVTTL